MVQTVKNRKDFTYRCRVCDFENRSKRIVDSFSDVPVTILGNYGDNATPTPATLSETAYTATSIAFTDAAGSDPAYLSDSKLGFGDNHIKSNWSITIVTTSGTNDGTYTIADRGVSRGELLLVDTDSLTDENAATAGTVVISRVIYQPNVTTGCPFCGSLNSKK